MGILIFTLPLCAYLVGGGFHWFYFAYRRSSLFQIANKIVWAGFLCHTAFLLSAFLFDLFFSSPLQKYVNFAAWMIIALYIAVERRYQIKALGSFMVPIALFVYLSSLVSPRQEEGLLYLLQHFWLVAHISLAILGNATFVLAFCVGVMYIILENQLKGKKLGRLYYRLPSLEVLDNLNFVALTVGVPLLTLGIVTGSIWARYTKGSFWSWEGRTWPLIFTWCIYLVLFWGRVYAGWRGRRAALLAIIGFLMVLLGYGIHVYGFYG
ncbi:MAG: hypothetical protein D6736_03745 [Nitrospinota bacterium]|nr:MAG: hypothetical protein D6736_03745 [Nitrospinota bacterium]